MQSEIPPDPTPLSGGFTDVAPLSSAGEKPAHEQTADEEAGAVPWSKIAADADLRALLKGKLRFIAPMTVFFVAYYFALPVSVGFFPETMRAKVGPANWAYAFALSQFFVAWAIAWVYTHVAAKWDAQAKAILEKFNRGDG